jgi:hypothetical protein
VGASNNPFERAALKVGGKLGPLCRRRSTGAFGDSLSQRAPEGGESSVMSATGSLPDLGGQVRPLIQTLPVGVQPRIMATLERAAADRYRTWTGACPEPVQAEGLRACAARARRPLRLPLQDVDVNVAACLVLPRQLLLEDGVLGRSKPGPALTEYGAPTRAARAGPPLTWSAWMWVSSPSSAPLRARVKIMCTNGLSWSVGAAYSSSPGEKREP